MKLSHVNIINYRSIEEATVDFVPRCRALVGINESGKTNVLSALALLSEKHQSVKDDVREPRTGEGPISQAYVRFVFDFYRSDKETIYRRTVDDVLAKDLDRLLLKDEKMSLRDFVNSTESGLFKIDLLKGTKFCQYWSRVEQGIVEGWLTPKTSSAAKTVTLNIDGKSSPLTKFKLIHQDSLPEGVAEYCEPASFQTVEYLVGSHITSWVQDNLPNCVLWSYSDNKLLPAQVSFDEFSSNPDKYEPLAHMFALAGHPEPQKSIADATQRKNGIRNLLRRVSEAATSHMRSVWKDYKKLEICIEPNGSNIEISVKDTFNQYEFSRRSDGFKRFISFLFLVSARTKTGDLQNTLYLHDEPDSGLHPSGAKHLMSELIEVSKNNYVVYSTHSIFMIDRSRADRHYIVKKFREKTTVEETNGSNFCDEEVLFNALQFSAFEIMKQFNLVFEGWKDKKLFDVAISGKSEPSRQLAKLSSDIGVCHAQGVKDIPKVSTLLEAANRIWLVVSDGDKPAREAQQRYDWREQWVRFDELVPEETINTGEDFVTQKKCMSVLTTICKRHKLSLGKDAVLAESGKLTDIERILSEARTPAQQVREIVSEFKDELFTSIAAIDVREIYFVAMQKAIERLNQLPEMPAREADEAVD
jgi:hypothetical protein